MMYPPFFSTSLSLSSTGLLIHASMSRTGTARSLVRTDSGAVSLGVLDLSSLLFFSFRGRVAGDLETLDLLVLNGESVRLVERPLLVRTPSLAVVDRGVGGLWMYDCSSEYDWL